MPTLCVSLLTLFLASPQHAEAIPYTFTKIAEDINSLGRCLGCASVLNDEGRAAFFAFPPGLGLGRGGRGLLTGTGGPLTTIVDTSGPIRKLPAFPTGQSVSANGTVVFRGLTRDRVGFLAGNGGLLTTTVDTTGPFRDFDHFPVINASGTAVFQGFKDGVGHGIFIGSGGPITTVYDTTGPFNELGRTPGINAAGTIVFIAGLRSGGGGFFTGTRAARVKEPAGGAGEPPGRAKAAALDEGDLHLRRILVLAFSGCPGCAGFVWGQPRAHRSRSSPLGRKQAGCEV